jgi:excisionase family DNA binding protein
MEKLTIKQVAEELGCSVVSASKLYHQGLIRGYRVFGRILVYRESLDEYVKAHPNAPAELPAAPAPVEPEAKPARQRPAPRATSNSPAGLQVLKLPPNWPLPGSTPP